MLLDFSRCFLGSNNAPHLIKCVHIKRQGIQLSLIVGNRGIGKPVKLSKLVYIIPNRFVVGVENMGTVNVDIDTLYLFGIHIACNVIPLVDDQHLFTGSLCLLRKHRAIQACANDQIIIHKKHLCIYSDLCVLSAF